MDFYDELQVGEDWLGRQEDFTYERKGAQIGWEETLIKGDPFSKFLLREIPDQINTPRKILLAKQTCNRLFSRMNPSGKKANIVFTGEFNSFYDGTNICTTLEPLNGKIKFPTFNHELDPILGFFIHEVAHHLYTGKEYFDYLRKYKGMEAKLKCSLMNIMEDERIEQKIAHSFRGYTGYLGKAKDYCFGLRYEEEKKKSGVAKNEITQLMNSILNLLRYPKALDRDAVNKFEKQLREVMVILTPYPDNFTDMAVATERIYELLKEFFDESQEPEQGKGEGEGGKGEAQTDDSESSQSTGKSEEGDSDDSESTKNKEPKDDEKQEESESGDDAGGTGEKEDDGEQDGDSKGGGEADDEGEQGNEVDGEDEPKETLEEALDALLDAINKAMPTPVTKDELVKALGGGMETGEALDAIEAYDNEIIENLGGSAAHSFPHAKEMAVNELSVIFNDSKKLKASTNNYDKGLEEVKSYAASLRAKIKQLNRNHTIVHRGLYEGDFDVDLLVDAIVGTKNVYKEENKIMNQGACIVLLVDESGSMSSGNRWYNAMKIAILFERALEGVNNTDFFCYGHTTARVPHAGHEDCTWINVYYEGRKKSDPKQLGKISEHSTNRDGHAILEVTARVRQQIPKDQPIVMFMISDGMPSASVPRGFDGESYTKKAVEVVERDANTTVIHIAIAPNIPSHTMFKHYVAFTDPNKLVHDVGELLKKIMRKQQKAMVS